MTNLRDLATMGLPVPFETDDSNDPNRDRVTINGDPDIYWQYPLENQEKQLMWIMFEEVELDWKDQFDEKPMETKQKRGFDIGQILSNVKSQASRSTNRELKKNMSGKGCSLYLPGSVQVQDGASYSTENLNTFGSTLMNALRGSGATDKINMQNLGKAFTDGINQATDPVLSFAEGLQNGEVPADAIVKLVSTVRALPFNIGSAEVDGVRAGLRRTANPHTTSIFNSVNLRKFTFSWEFVPSNAKEAVQMRKIIQFFRESLYPELTTSAESFENADFFTYKFPVMIRPKIGFIHPKTGEFRTELDNGTPFAFKIKDCYIESVNVTFDDKNSMTIHPDGHFVSAKMDVTLSEEFALSKGDIRGGY